MKLFETEIFGRIPANTPKVKWEVASTEPNALDGTAIMKKVTGQMSDRADGPRMNVTMYIPSKAKWPVPVILTITFGGGGAEGFPGKAFGGKGDPVAAEVLGRGWAYATVGYGDIQPDKDNAWDQGVIGLTPKPAGQTSRNPNEWGTIGAWTWGISRIVDYFETDKAIDAKRIRHSGSLSPGPDRPLGRRAGSAHRRHFRELQWRSRRRTGPPRLG